MSEPKQEEYREVTVKVPLPILKVILDQNYFGYSPGKFFTDCIRFGVTCYFDSLLPEERQRLEDIYKVKEQLRVQL